MSWDESVLVCVIVVQWALVGGFAYQASRWRRIARYRAELGMNLAENLSEARADLARVKAARPGGPGPRTLEEIFRN